MDTRKVELDWSLTSRGTVIMDVPEGATDDEILDVFWDRELNEPADREDFNYEIYEVGN